MNSLKKAMFSTVVGAGLLVGATAAHAVDTDQYGVSNTRGGSVVGSVTWLGPQQARLRGTTRSDNDGQPAQAWVRFCRTAANCGPWLSLGSTNGSLNFDRTFYSSDGGQFLYADVTVMEQGVQSPIDRNQNGGA